MRGHIRKRGKHSWSIAIYLGKDERGKSRYGWHTVRGTAKTAEAELTRLLNQLNLGEYIETSTLTVAEYLERWLADYALTNVSARTYERYKEIIDCHLIPAFGPRQLTKLQPMQIQASYSQALQSGRRNHTGGLSARTVLCHHRVLKNALKQAVRWRLLLRNPGDSVDPPRPREREMRALDEKQTAALLKAAQGTSLHLPILLAVGTGMRRGEILAVRWSDLDLAKGTLAVCQSLEQTKAGLKFKAPKTRRGRRVIALPHLLTTALRQHKAKQAALRLRMGAAYIDQDLICASPDGSPRSPGGFGSGFVKFISGLDIPRVRFHDLRHSHATQLLRQGVHPKIVSERLGHSTIGITLDTYSHVLPGMQEDAAKKIDTALRAAMRRGKNT